MATTVDASIPLGYKPPDPMQQLSGMLGVRQQKQELQSGLLTIAKQREDLKTAASGAIEAQQKAKEMQAGSQLLADPVGNGIIDENGNPTKTAYATIKAAMPITGDDHYDSLLKISKGHVEFKNSVQNLSQNEQGYISSRLAGIAADPNAHISDVVRGLDDLKTQFKGTAEEESIHKLLDVVRSGVDDAGDHHGMDGVRKVVNGFSRGAIGNQGLTGAGGVATPQNATVDQGGQIQPGTTAPALQGGGFNPSGPPIAKTLGPSIVQTPAGPLARVGDNGSTVTPLQTAGTGQPGAAPPQNLNMTTAQAQTQQGLARGITDRVTQATLAANNTIQAQDALSRAKAILESPAAPNTGAAFDNKKKLLNLVASLGVEVKGTEDENSLVKNLARYEASRATQAGLGGTDAARELAHNGSPNTQIDKQALSGIVNQSLATEKALAAYANVQSKTKDPDALTKNENAFRNIPHLIEAYEYGMSRNKEEANAFLKKHGVSAKEMKASMDAVRAFEKQ